MGKRAGWKAQPTIYRLNFEGDQFEGLTVEAKSMPLGGFFGLQELQARAETDLDAAKQVIRRLASVLVAWNVEDEHGQPVPAVYAVCKVSGKPGEPGAACPECASGDGSPACDYTGLVGLELPFVLQIFRAWMQAVASVPNPSPPPSNGGGTFPEQSIPMEVSSVSHQN